MLHKDSLVRGAFILAAGSLLSRTLGAVYRLLLPILVGGGEQGAYALGLYNYSYRIYSVALVISTVGLPLAVSRLVSQRLAHDDGVGIRRVFVAARFLLAALGLAFTVALAGVAPLFARAVDPNALYPILAIAPAVFLVSLMSAYRGLFQGLQVMTPYAVSQVVEQVVRVGTILAAAVLLLPWGIPAAMAGASFGAVTGAAAALVYLWYKMRRHRSELDAVLAVGRPLRRNSWSAIVREIMSLAIPISLASLAFPVISLIDLGVPILLQAGGLDPAAATTAYGALSQAEPFLNVPLTLTTGFALSLVPAITGAASRGDAPRVRRGIGASLRIALIITVPAVTGLVLLAHDLAAAFYDYAAAGDPLQVLAVAALFIGVQQMSSGVLQGLGRPMIPVRNLAWGVVIKAALTWLLVPPWGVTGAAAATVAAFTVTAALNLASVARLAGGMGFAAGELVRPVAASLVMAVAVLGVRPALAPHLGLFLTTVAAAGVGAAVYGVALLLVGGIRAADLELVPGLARRVLPHLRRWGLIRD
ncbi:MAG TPA: polysaccharide biosynthesis C-terminal domain-containing protein [Bacillota bacterium]